MNNNGQIQLSWVLAMAAISFIAAPLIGYFSSQLATETKINGVDKEVGIVKSRVDNIERKLDSMDLKLDALLLNNKIQIKK